MQSIVQCIGFSVLGGFFFSLILLLFLALRFFSDLGCIVCHLPPPPRHRLFSRYEILFKAKSELKSENERKSERERTRERVRWGENEWEFEWPIYMCNSFNMPLSAPQFILSIDESIQWETIDNSPPRATHAYTHTYRFPIKIDFGYSFYGLLVIVIHRMSIFALLSTMHARMR